MKAALFDTFLEEKDGCESIKKEIYRILNSRSVKSSFPGIGSNFGLPSVSEVNYRVQDLINFEKICAEHLIKYEPRIDKAKVQITSLQNGMITLNIDVYTNKSFDENPIRFNISI